MGLATRCLPVVLAACAPSAVVPDDTARMQGELGPTPDGAERSVGETWEGYNAVQIVLDGEEVCDQVWDTLGSSVDVACPQCELVVELEATLRSDVGAGTACDVAEYAVTYGWRTVSSDPNLPVGVLRLQDGEWVWIGDARRDQDLWIGEVERSVDEEVTHIYVVGRLHRAE